MKPFKVLCKESEWEDVEWWKRIKEKIFGRNKPDPIEGHIYTVIKFEEGYYTLEEFSEEECYRMEYFIPIDECKAVAYVSNEVHETQLN